MCTRSGFFLGNRAVSVLLGLLHDSNPGRIFQRSYRRRHRYSCCGGRLDAGYFLDSRLHVHVFEQLVSFNSSHRISSLDGMSSRCVMLLKLLECSIEFECRVVFTSRVCVFCDRCSLSKHDKSNRKKSSRAWKEYELQHCHAWRTVRVITSTFVAHDLCQSVSLLIFQDSCRWLLWFVVARALRLARPFLHRW